MENHVFFGSFNLQVLSHAKSAYDIGFYIYQLDTFGLDVESIREQYGQTSDYVTYSGSDFNINNICIKHVPLPRNSIEERLYPHVKAYLEPHLPIKFTLVDKYGDDYCRLKPKCDVNIKFNTSIYKWNIFRSLLSKDELTKSIQKIEINFKYICHYIVYNDNTQN